MVEQNGRKFRRLEKAIKKITFERNSHSTDLSFSGEEGHSTILLAHLMFWFQLRTKLFSNAGYAAKLHEKCQEILLLLSNLHIFASDQIQFLFFRATFVTKRNF